MPHPPLIARALCLCLAAGPVRAEGGRDITAEQFFSVCEAATVEAAGALGDALGWRRMTEAERADWTRAIEADQGVRAASVGWRRGEAEEADALAFWTVAGGGQRYRACAYSTRTASDLAEAFRRRYGAPASTSGAEQFHTAFWASGRSEVTESRAGVAIVFTIITDD